jgi:hypothetical protein
MSGMIGRSTWLCLSPLILLLFRQAPGSDAAHIKQWTERHAQYLSLPAIEETDSWLEIRANAPRPLEGVLGALARQHGWHINYEDPVYGKSDIVDDTAPSWLKEHPTGPRAWAVRGGVFYAKIPLDGYFPDDPTQVLPALVDSYNRSGNPGTFKLLTRGPQSFDVVGTAAGDGPQMPLLDTVMGFDAAEEDNAEVTLQKFCKELSQRSGKTVGFGSPPSANRLFQTHIRQHWENLPARESLRQLYTEIGSTFWWRLFYDPDTNKFWLRMDW